MRISDRASSAWRYSIFGVSHTRWEKANFYHRLRNKRRLRCKAFELTQASLPTEHVLLFMRCEKNLPGSAGEFSEQPLTFSVPTRDSDNNGNETSTPHHGACNYQQWQYVSIQIPTWPYTQYEIIHQVLAVVMLRWIKKQESPVLAVRKILRPLHL